MADRAKGMRALLKEGGSVRLARVPEPVIAAGDDVLVRVAFAGVCRTDLLVGGGLGWEFAPSWRLEIGARARVLKLSSAPGFDSPGVLQLALSTSLDKLAPP